MNSEQNPYQILIGMGIEAWNRWARTKISDEDIDSLLIPDYRKKEIKSISPIPLEEQSSFANSLGKVDFDSLETIIFFNEFPVQVEFDDFIFPGPVVFSGCSFGSVLFQRAVFTGGADFSDTIFNGDAYFGQAVFNGPTKFDNATFNGIAMFGGTTHKNNLSFINSTFQNSAVFSESTFSAESEFSNSTFSGATWFFGTNFASPPRFHNVDLHQDTSFHQADYTSIGDNEKDMRAWRTLKLAMNKTHHHDQELLYFGYEMDTKRLVLKKSNSYPKWLLLSCYKWFSGYGVSIVKPLVSMALFWMIFAVLYGYLWLGSDLIEGMKLSFANLLPFVPTSVSVLSGTIESHELEFNLQIAMATQNVISTILLFTIGIALRHVFSIK